MAFQWVRCFGCGRNIKSHFSYCPVCNTNKPFQCCICRKRFSGPLQQGVGISKGKIRCSSCATKPQVVRINLRGSAPKYGRHYTRSGMGSTTQYGSGYSHGYDDARKRRAYLPCYMDTRYVTGYSDGFRAGHP